MDADDPRKVAAAIDETTKAVYVETIGNPKLDVPDFRALAQVAHAAGVPLVVDNTFGTPLPREAHRARADACSTAPRSRWRARLGDRRSRGRQRTLDSAASPRFASFYTEPEPAYRLKFAAEAFSNLAFAVRLRVDVATSSDALAVQLVPFPPGLETLHLRIERHVANALAIARFLEKHPHVAWVRYPGLESHPTPSTAKKYLRRRLRRRAHVRREGRRGSREEDDRRVRLFSYSTNVGDADLVIHPWSTTHEQLTEEERLTAGVGPDLVRLSVGIEDVRDLLEDLDEASATGATR